MRTYVYLNPEMINDDAIQLLKPREHWKKFRAALAGETNEFSRFIKRRKTNRASGPVWAALRTAVFKRDDYTCQYCGTRGGRLECDHVYPVSRGGQDTLLNTVTACFKCNRSKRDKTIEEWMRT